MSSQYRVKITHYQLLLEANCQHPYVEYYILIDNRYTLEVKSQRFRYKQLRNLHEQIKNQLEKLKIVVSLPPFPHRKVISNTNAQAESVSLRKQQIEKYLNQLLCIPQVQCLSLVSSILPPSVLSASEGSCQGIKNFYIALNSKNQPNKNLLFQMIEKNNKMKGKASFRQELLNPQNKKTEIAAQIHSFDKNGDIIFYNISFQHLDSNFKWEIKCRYRDLKNLSMGIKDCSNKKEFLPEFPKSHIFKSTNSNPEEVQKRKENIQIYLNEILDIDNIYQNNECLRNFIDSSKIQAISQELTNQSQDESISKFGQRQGGIDITNLNNFSFQKNNNWISLNIKEQPEVLIAKQQKLLYKKIKSASFKSFSSEENDF